MGTYYNFSGFKSKSQRDKNEIAVAVESNFDNRKLSEFTNIESGYIDRMITVALGFILKYSNKRNKVYVGYNYDFVRDKRNYVDAQQSFISDKAVSEYTALYQKAVLEKDAPALYIVCLDTKEYINYSEYFNNHFHKPRALDILGHIFNQDVIYKHQSDEELPNWYRKAVYATTDINDIKSDYTDVTAEFD